MHVRAVVAACGAVWVRAACARFGRINGSAVQGARIGGERRAYIKKTFSSYNRSTYKPSLTVNYDAGESQTVANGTYARSGVRLMVFLSNAVRC